MTAPPKIEEVMLRLESHDPVTVPFSAAEILREARGDI